MHTPSIRVAETADERLQASRFRYEVLRALRERFADGHEVDTSVDGVTLVATDTGRMVGSADVHLGADAPLPEPRASRLGVGSTTGDAPIALVAVLDEIAVHPDADPEVATGLLARAVHLAATRGARWVFATCAPDDLATFRALGFRASESPMAGTYKAYSIPVALDLAQAHRLRELGSPFAADAVAWARATAHQADLAANAALDSGRFDAVRTPEASAAAASKVAHAVRASRAGFLSAIDQALRADVLRGAVRLTPQRDEAVATRGERNRDLYLVLRGAVEVRRNGRRLGVHGPGDVVGEVAFLLETSRSADLVAATDDVIVMRIPAEHLTSLAERDAATAAPLWLGLALSLANKLTPADG